MTVPPSFPAEWLTTYDLHLLAEGTHLEAFEKLGAHPFTVDGATGTAFAVWAPNARGVSVIGDFNGWHNDAHPLRLRPEAGVWEGFVAGVYPGDLYKFAVLQSDGSTVQKADPFAFYSEQRPRSASIVWDLDRYAWGDSQWIEKRPAAQAREAPIAVYEVHLGSWARVPEEGDRWLTYRELAPRLAEYVRDLGYTHVELLPITEHPFDASWGYQPLGYFAPTSRFGTPDDFMAFVDTLHQAGIGVLLDWVPGHFPTDAHGLARFDGTYLYEHADPLLRDHPDWGTSTFNLGRREVANFLIASALFWIRRYHVDGLRVDAVASMLYRDYSRREGEWIPHPEGGRNDLDAVRFLQRFNETVYTQQPGVITVAEESTAWPLVSRPVSAGGLGFGFKWNMGWMHDTLEFMARDPVHRGHHLDNLTFGLLYAFNEDFVLVYSHDEVVHGKGSMLAKMPGDDWQKFANLRLLYGYQYGHPGKKLLFMGSEFGQWSEWNEAGSLEWDLLQYERHRGLQQWVRALNELYRTDPALYELDGEGEGFSWIDCTDSTHAVVSFLRKSKGGARAVLVVCNFTPVPREGYRIGSPLPGDWEVLLNSDETRWGGSGYSVPSGFQAGAHPMHGYPQSLDLTLPPLGLLVLQPVAQGDRG
ncbi:MAG: 1,4-alpha-glucan branching protein GlgB [Dehalococcoidia bacterium]|nr:1,4-alpha-glucan branching protein GlgB [Dehalococcoidia bacterium]